MVEFCTISYLFIVSDFLKKYKIHEFHLTVGIGSIKPVEKNVGKAQHQLWKLCVATWTTHMEIQTKREDGSIKFTRKIWKSVQEQMWVLEH